MVARVCLVTSGHLATNPRLVKEADALTNAGYRVSIVATRFLSWAEAADAEFATRPWSVHSVAFGSFAAPLPRVYRSLRRHAARSFVTLFGPRLAAVERAMHWVIPELTRAAKAVPADLFIAHNLPALPAAVRAAKRHGARVMFDAEDFHSGELPESSAWDRERALVTAVERYYLPQCDALTAASPGIARAYAERYGIPMPTVVLNAFPRDMAPPQATEKGSAEPGPSIYWFSQTIGPDRGLETAIEAIALCKSRPDLYLRGNISDSFQSALTRLAERHGVAGRLHLLPPAPPKDMVRLAAQYDLGLAAETTHTENRRIALTNKIFVYLLAGVPAVASRTAAQSELADMAPDAVLTYAPDDPVSLSESIDNLLLDAPGLRASRKVAWSLAQRQFNWEVESQRWLSAVAAQLRAAT